MLKESTVETVCLLGKRKPDTKVRIGIDIHPFQDGNGRVGRLIALKECLRYSIVPFIIEDSKKMFYYRGLSEWEREKGYLMDTCLDGQDTFKSLMALFDIP